MGKYITWDESEPGFVWIARRFDTRSAAQAGFNALKAVPDDEAFTPAANLATIVAGHATSGAMIAELVAQSQRLAPDPPPELSPEVAALAELDPDDATPAPMDESEARAR